MAELQAVSTDVLARLRARVGHAAIDDDEQSRALVSDDVYARGARVLAVARPTSTSMLSAIVAEATAAGCAVLPRGGGMSYTAGYVSDRSDAIVIDMGAMNQVVEINREDMTVTVECGCTWAALHKALEGSGLRTPFWGTLSGLRATVGGGLSQNAIFWGSGQFGTAADSVLSLQVVLADGTVLETGSAAQRAASPFFRHFGPDLTGLFTGDTGALGFKARATLRLMPELPAKAYVAFDFKDGDAVLAAMSEVGRQNLVTECFGFDPFLQAQRLKRQSMRADVKALKGVMKASGSVLGALRDGARVAVTGRGYMDKVDYSVQMIIEDRIDAGAKARADAVREICKRHGGREIEDSIPRITRANPFGPLNSMLGPAGERWLPVHGVFPHSRIREAFARTQALFDARASECEALGVGTGYLFAIVSTHGFVLEPVFFWPDELYPVHEAGVERDHLARLPRHEPNPESRALVATLRQELVDLYSDLGATHFQVGRSYRYRDDISAPARSLMDTVKAAVDPAGLVNPGSLGFGGS